MARATTAEKIEFLKLLHTEWMFRVENFWKKITQFFIIIFFTSTLPISISVFDKAKLPKINCLVFPFGGLLLSVFFLWFSLSEAVRIKAVDSRIQTIIGECFGDTFQKNTNTMKSPFGDHKKAHPIFCWPMVRWIPIMLASIEILIAAIMFYVIASGSLTA